MLKKVFAVRLNLRCTDANACEVTLSFALSSGVNASSKRVDPILRGLCHPWKEAGSNRSFILRKNYTKKTTTKRCILKSLDSFSEDAAQVLAKSQLPSSHH